MTTTPLDAGSSLAPPSPGAGARPVAAHVLRGAAVALVAGAALFLLDAGEARLRFGVPLGALLTLACAWGVLDVARSFEPRVPPSGSVAARDLARPLGGAALSALVIALSLAAAVHAVVPEVVAGVALTAGAVGLVASVFLTLVALGPWRLDEDGQERPLRRRHGFWLLVATCLLYLPALGIGSLTDPWETHYGEVAREVLARDDWLSLWWSWQGFFYSKPVLGIWLQSLMMGTLGVHVEPDRMLEGVGGHLAHPEWAVRFPFCVFAIVGVYLLYKGVARWAGRRAALVGAFAMATSPQWFLVAHQSMTDMPYVAALTAALGLVLLAVRASDDARVGSWEVRFGARAVTVDAAQVVLGGILACVLPQIVYLASRNVELVSEGAGAHGLRPHLDEVLVGSALGNCGEPGDVACSHFTPTSPWQPWMQALAWLAGLVVLVLLCKGERRTKRLLYVGGWLLAALSTMEKGPAGLAIPGACVALWLLATRRWGEIPRAALGVGLLTTILVVGPWFAAVFVRHGTQFTDELIFHDMFNRTFEHVHDTNGGADTSLAYYIGQLGYALFPWIALVPAGVFLLREGRDGERDVVILLVMWLLVAFALFPAMGTKFHHYILPAVPPAAMLAGLALERLARARDDQSAHDRVLFGAAAVAGALVLALVARDLLIDPAPGTTDGAARFIQLFTYRYDRAWPAALSMHTPILVIACAGAASLLLATAARTRRLAAGAWVAVATLACAWGVDVYLPRASYFWGQRAVIGAYYEQRESPAQPIVAYRMNWKGENFYTGNRIPQFGTPTVPAGTPSLSSWADAERHKGTSVAYFVTERVSVGGLRGELKPKELHEVTTRDDCEQFVLVRAVL